uniref:Caspase-1 n=1 Tax=Cairina moschata TaxID=8855 RepID=A0A8C3C7V1_CAIMO
MSERNASPPSAEPAAGPRPSARPQAYPVTGRGARGGAGRGARRPMRNHSASRRGQSARGQTFTSGRAALGPWGLGVPVPRPPRARPGGCCRWRGPRGEALGRGWGPGAGRWRWRWRGSRQEAGRERLGRVCFRFPQPGRLQGDGGPGAAEGARGLCGACAEAGDLEASGRPAGPQGSPGVQPPVSIQGQQWIRQCSLSEYQRIQEAEGNQIYPILLPRETRTRRALLICNTEFEHLRQREGAEVDVKEMTKLLEGLGYRVDFHENLTSQEMATVMKDFAGHKDHLTSDSTFLVFMSHGRRTGLCGTKSRDETTDILSLDTIYENFNNKHCKALIGKPKVVIIQSCRGDNRGSVLVSDSAISEVPALSSDSMNTLKRQCKKFRVIHLESDFATLYSSTPDTLSWRSPVTGSIFIQRLVEQFRSHAFNSDLQELFRKVQRSFEDFPRQLPTQERTTMLRKFYLFPGH